MTEENRNAAQGCLGLIVIAVVLGVGCEVCFDGSDSDSGEMSEAACRQDLQCWADRHATDVEVYCADLIADQSVYAHEWVDGWVEPKFDRIAWTDQDVGSVRYIGDKLRVQNVYGAWMKVTYSVVWNPRTEHCSEPTIVTP